MEWYRAYHGMPMDNKLNHIARQLGIRRGEVLEVWVCCLDYASQHPSRGSVKGIDPDLISSTLEMEPDRVEAVLQCFRLHKLIHKERLSAWKRRNPVSDDSALRKRQYRKALKQQQLQDNMSRDKNGTGTGHFSRTEQNRTEQTREDQNRKEHILHAGAVAAPEAVPKPNGKSETSRPNGHSGRPSEWPQTASAICESFPATDDVAISSVVQSLVQAYCGIDHPMIELSDGLLAEAIRKAKFPDQKSALGFRKAGAELVRNWALGRGNPPRGKRVYTPPMAVEAS